MTRTVVVFGGTGFFGRRVVRHLLDRSFAVRVASRHPQQGKIIFPNQLSKVEFLRADIGDDASIRKAIDGAFGVVNCVSLYVERSSRTFHSVHVESVERLARHSCEAGLARLVHVSGIGANAASSSPYIRSRREGDAVVRTAFPTATIIRSAVMFGPNDAFLAPLTALLRRFPVFPIFGRGRTRLQPVYVDDVADAIARIVDSADTEPAYEVAGPRIYTYKELLQAVSDSLGVRRRALVPLPFVVWQALAFLAEFLPQPPITRSQVELMKVSNIAASGSSGLSALGIEPHGIEVVLSAK